MNITIDTLKAAMAKLGYKWFTDRPNLIGIRTTLQIPDVFNDLFCLVWVQGAMPTGLTDIQKQDWLNKNNFIGKNGVPLTVDGNFGDNSKFALDQYTQSVGKERLKFWTITTDPGSFWLLHPENPLGTAVLKPGQYVDCWSIGFHKNKPDHPALVQVGKITVYRDVDCDNIAEEKGKEDTGLFGVNIHRSNATGKTMVIYNWSAGCQVFQVKTDHDQLMSVCNMYKDKVGNKFTYTLLREKELS
jgi:hypothetical protein